MSFEYKGRIFHLENVKCLLGEHKVTYTGKLRKQLNSVYEYVDVKGEALNVTGAFASMLEDIHETIKQICQS